MASLGSAGAAVGSIAAVLALGVFAACEGSQFTASDVAGGAGGEAPQEGGAPGSAGMAMGSSGSAAGGEGAMAGNGEAGSASGGAPSEGCTTNVDCEAGTFCRQGSCSSCSELGELAELTYGNPESLDVINVTMNQDHLRFPRPAGSGAGVVYTRDFFGGHLWFTSDPTKSPGSAITVAQGVFEMAGLYVPFALPEPLTGYNFFFHRAVPASADTTQLFGAKMDENGAVTGAQELPAPLNQVNVTASYSIALSKNRVVWTRNLDGGLSVRLMTLALPPDGTEPVELRLPMPFDCGFANELEYAPWLTPDGRTLFFTARVLDDSCAVTADTPTRLYVIELSASGEPQGIARALTDLGSDVSRQTDAALSPDGCHLLYSATYEASMGLYRAERLK